MRLVLRCRGKIKPIETLAFSPKTLKAEFVEGAQEAIRFATYCGILFGLATVSVVGFMEVSKLVVPFFQVMGNAYLLILPLAVTVAAGILALGSWRPQLILNSGIALVQTLSAIVGFSLVAFGTTFVVAAGPIVLLLLAAVVCGSLGVAGSSLLVRRLHFGKGSKREGKRHLDVRAIIRRHLLPRLFSLVAVTSVGAILAIPLKQSEIGPHTIALYTGEAGVGLLVTLVIGFYCCFALVPGAVTLAVVIPSALVGGIWGACTQGLRGADLDERAFPNQGIYRTAAYAAIVACVAALAFGVAFIVIGQVADFLHSTRTISGHSTTSAAHLSLLRIISIRGSVGALLGGALFAIGVGRAVCQHYAVRIVLWFSRETPWRLVTVLDDASNFAFLRKVGGSYLFIHRALQEYFGRNTTVAKALLIEKSNSSRFRGLKLCALTAVAAIALIEMTYFETRLIPFGSNVDKQLLSVAYLMRGINSFFNRSYGRAVKELTLSVKLNPESAPAYQLRANSYYYEKKYDLAVADYTRAFALSPPDAKMYFLRALANDGKGDCRRAIGDLTYALALTPEDYTLYNLRGLEYAKIERYAAAIADYSHAIVINRSYGAAFYNRGVAYENEGQYELAISDFRDAIALGEYLADAYSERALTYFDLGDGAKAMSDLREAVKLNPKLPHTLANLKAVLSGGRRRAGSAIQRE